jgi:hypothetical protein
MQKCIGGFFVDFNRNSIIDRCINISISRNINISINFYNISQRIFEFCILIVIKSLYYLWTIGSSRFMILY